MPVKERFYLELPCKPYVKRFLEINYGDPGDLSPDPILTNMLFHYLRKPNKKDLTRYDNRTIHYSQLYRIKLPEFHYRKFGNTLTRPDVVSFGKMVERRAKLFMRNIVGVNIALGLPIFVAINKFQDQYGFDEDTWSFESIKKDFYRNGCHHKVDFDHEVYEKIHQILLVQLSESGTITRQALKAYENPK
jgi:hypothetical protein